MTEEGSRSSSIRNHAILAALASLFLASCSTTTDGDSAMFGFSPQYGPTGVPTATAEEPTEIAEASGGFEVPDDSTVEAILAAQADASMTEEASAEMSDGDDPTQLAAAATEDPSPAAPDPARFGAVETPDEAMTAFAAAPEPKRGFLSAFFSQDSRPAVPVVDRGAVAPLIPETTVPAQASASASQPIANLSAAPSSAPAPRDRLPTVTSSLANDALPGVRDRAGLFEISRRDGTGDSGDLDLYEEGGSYQVASAAGLARLAPNGLRTQTDDVDVACLRPALVRILRTIESRFGKPVVVTSGYRSQDRNRRARGARNSLHMHCAAADIQVPGVSRDQLASFVRAMPGRGGVGTYCHTASVHVDVGPERDWNWRCRRKT